MPKFNAQWRDINLYRSLRVRRKRRAKPTHFLEYFSYAPISFWKGVRTVLREGEAARRPLWEGARPDKPFLAHIRDLYNFSCRHTLISNHICASFSFPLHRLWTLANLYIAYDWWMKQYLPTRCSQDVQAMKPLKEKGWHWREDWSPISRLFATCSTHQANLYSADNFSRTCTVRWQSY